MMEFKCKRKNLPCTAPICSCPRITKELPSEKAIKMIRLTKEQEEDVCIKIDVLSKECPHCKFISETFGEKMSNREYWLMTEIFVYLHGTDECNFVSKSQKQ